MNNKIKKIEKLINECYDKNGDMMLEQELSTYQDGLIKALKVLKS